MVLEGEAGEWENEELKALNKEKGRVRQNKAHALMISPSLYLSEARLQEKISGGKWLKPPTATERDGDFRIPTRNVSGYREMRGSNRYSNGA